MHLRMSTTMHTMTPIGNEDRARCPDGGHRLTVHVDGTSVVYCRRPHCVATLFGGALAL
jgi:hypothetical protein